jgi:hypothetical protein
MTLILSLLTEHEVVQVSDRRFTFSRPDGSVVSRNDERNKAVLFCGRVLFGFAGRGDLGVKRSTDFWLADRICKVLGESPNADHGTLLAGIAESASTLFSRAYRGQRQAFVAVGWARFGDNVRRSPVTPEQFTPYLARISNFHGNDGAELATVNAEFSVFLHMQPAGGGYVLDVPRHLSDEERRRLVKDLRDADRARSVNELVEILGDQVRAVADRDSGVGRGLMISVLPRAALGDASALTVLAGGPNPEAQSFLYVPPSGDTAVQLGPVATCGQGVAAGFRAEPIPEGWNAPVMPASLPDDPPGLVRRWYLVPVAGSGTDIDPYRAETLGHSASAFIPSGPDGRPRHNIALAVVSAVGHEDLEGHPDIHALADLADLDETVDGLPPHKRAWLKSAARDRGVSLDGRARDVIRRIGEQLEPGFREDGYWTS